MNKKQKKIWKEEPDTQDFTAAQDYLELHFRFDIALDVVTRLGDNLTVCKKAKDILRASGLPLLPRDNIHVKRNVKKVKKGKKLSPILLVAGNKLLIADGYHRVCAIYYLSEDLVIPCRITHRGQTKK